MACLGHARDPLSIPSFPTACYPEDGVRGGLDLTPKATGGGEGWGADAVQLGALGERDTAGSPQCSFSPKQWPSGWSELGGGQEWRGVSSAPVWTGFCQSRPSLPRAPASD